MGKWLLLILLVLRVLTGGYYAYWVAREAKSEGVRRESRLISATDNLQPPDELVTGYDPSVSVGLFGVTMVDPAGDRTELMYRWPKNREGQRVSSTIACQNYPIYVFEPSSKMPRIVSNQSLIKIMAETAPERMLLQAKCGDSVCTKIVDECQLTIKEARQENAE